MFKNANGEFVEQTESLLQVFNVLPGVLTAGVGQILNFWFGGLIGRKSNES